LDDPRKCHGYRQAVIETRRAQQGKAATQLLEAENDEAKVGQQ